MKTMPLSLLASSTLWYLYKIVYILPIYSHLEQLAPMIDEFKCQVRVLSNELKKLVISYPPSYSETRHVIFGVATMLGPSSDHLDFALRLVYHAWSLSQKL